MKLNLNFDLYKGTTRLKQWWKEVKAHFTEVQEAHNALEDTVAAESGKLSTEITQRTNADTVLQQNITAEANIRATVDTALDGKITTEANTRSSADTTLQQNINSETSARTTADNALDGRIKAVRKDIYGGYIVDGSFSDSDFQVQVDSSYSNATVTVTAGKSIKINGVQVSLPASFTISRISPADNVIQLYAEYDTTAKTIEWYCDSSSTYWPYYLNDNILQVYTCQIYFDLVYTDGVLVDVRPTVTSVGNIGLEITKNLSDLKTENKNSFLDAVNENADKINYFISLRPSDREIFVMCDGDHDELKIQEALDTVGVGGTVYPVGYTIALSNSNVVTSYVSGFKSILKIPAYVTLDFRYCSNAVVFYNDAPATMQILFDLGQNSTLSNVKIDIDEDTVLSTSITPTLINTRTYCVIDNLTLCNWFGLSSTLSSVYGIYVGQYGLFRNNNITNWDCGKLGSGQSLIRFEANTKLYDNTFNAITAEAGSGGNLFYFGLCTGSNNKFYNLSFGGSKLNVGSGYSFFSQNDFYKLSDARFSINGLWSCNMFRTLTGVNDDYMFTLASNAKMDNNKFIALTQSSEEDANCFSMSNAHFTNNQFISISISANTAFIAASSGIIANNLFNARNVSDTINIVECVNGAVVKDNCTNASSIGTYDSTCVVEGNVTGFGV